MRINKYLSLYTDLSRRSVDKLIERGKILANGEVVNLGQKVDETDKIILNGKIIKPKVKIQTIILNKPVGYVCSRNGQGSKTIYDLLPKKLHSLNPVGRLDKDSSGLLLLTNNGDLAQKLTHPKYQKVKIYEVKLDKFLQPLHQQMISDKGITLSDGLSKFIIERDKNHLKITMSEGRNRQIRRTFQTLGYSVVKLHRVQFGPYELGKIANGKFRLN